MRISGSLNLPQPVTEEVAAATSSSGGHLGSDATTLVATRLPEHGGKTWSSWERIRCELSQARFAIGDVANHDGLTRLVAIPGHGFKSQHIKMIKHIKRTNASSGLFERGVPGFPWLQALQM